MYNITLVSTNHSELGKCNSDELYKIIESIKPDVIFEELSPVLFDMLYNQKQVINEPLEIKAIKRYLLNYNVRHIPVDIDVSQNLSTRDIEFMFSEFGKYAIYRQLGEEQNRMAAQDGFAFLNSKKTVEIFAKKRIVEMNLIEFMMTNKTLLGIHKLFYEEQDQRELAIIKNIYRYSEENKYNRALFFIGVGHRGPIMKKIKMANEKETVKLNWVFYGD
jgi:hypothetical protein